MTLQWTPGVKELIIKWGCSKLLLTADKYKILRGQNSQIEITILVSVIKSSSILYLIYDVTNTDRLI